MAETFKQILTKKQLEEGRLPSNTVLLEMTYTSEGIKSKGGVIIGINLDDEYEDETTSHVADFAEVYARVYKVPDKLYYNRSDPNSMPWDCDQELCIGDRVFFNALESKNAVEIVCEDKLYKLIPYQDIYCAKRKQQLWEMISPFEFALHYKGNDPEEALKKEFESVIMLNGYILCEPVFTSIEHKLAIENKKEDRTRGIVRFFGKPNRSYHRPEYVDFLDLRVGDEVLYSPSTPLFKLERTSALAQFDGNNLYNVVQRRRVAMILKRN